MLVWCLLFSTQCMICSCSPNNQQLSANLLSITGEVWRNFPFVCANPQLKRSLLQVRAFHVHTILRPVGEPDPSVMALKNGFHRIEF